MAATNRELMNEHMREPGRMGMLAMVDPVGHSEGVVVSSFKQLEHEVLASIAAGFFIRCVATACFAAAAASPRPPPRRRSDEVGAQQLTLYSPIGEPREVMWGCGTSSLVVMVVVLSKSVCWRCGAACSSRCGGCGLAMYCDVACQRGNHKRHKRACKAIVAAVVSV
jgi:hypothetical protein